CRLLICQFELPGIELAEQVAHAGNQGFFVTRHFRKLRRDLIGITDEVESPQCLQQIALRATCHSNHHRPVDSGRDGLLTEANYEVLQGFERQVWRAEAAVAGVCHAPSSSCPRVELCRT